MRAQSKLKRRTAGDRISDFIIGFFLAIMVLITVYPFWHVIMYSFSDSHASMTGGIFLWPRDFSLLSYQQILGTKQIWMCYRNSVMKTVVGTTLSLLLTSMTAYPLSVARFKGRNFFSMLIFFTMLFSGGMIPSYLLIRDLHLLDTFWVYVVPGMMSAYNMFILRNFFQSIPSSLEESAMLDGANPFQILFKIMLPLSLPAIAALAMFYGVGLWNGYMDNVLYVNNSHLQLLQNYLRQLLMIGAKTDMTSEMTDIGAASRLTEETVKMTVISISVIPVLMVYPFLQKYYTKGVMIGSVKG
jgi:putative aldouronate transport system permease protein